MAKDPISVARENVEAGNAQDWPRFKATMADGVVYDEVGTGRKMKGADQWVEAYQGWFKAFPDVKGKITNAFASGDNTATVEVTWDGTQTGPFVGPAGTLPPSGKRQVTRATLVLTVDDGKIKEAHHYFDMLSLLQQIGALPA